MEVEIKNHSSIKAAMVRFVMVMSQKSSVDDTRHQLIEIKALKATAATSARLLVEVKKNVNEALAKNTSLQSQLEKLKSVARSKCWAM